MREYESLHLVKSEDLNHHGTLFAARAAAWFVEAGFAAAACESGSTEVVLRNLQNMSFSKPVKAGSVTRFLSRVVYAGSSSLVVCVRVLDAVSGEKAVEGYITFVTIEEATGQKRTHGIVLDETGDEEELRQRAGAAQFLKAGR